MAQAAKIIAVATKNLWFRLSLQCNAVAIATADVERLVLAITADLTRELGGDATTPRLEQSLELDLAIGSLEGGVAAAGPRAATVLVDWHCS